MTSFRILLLLLLLPLVTKAEEFQDKLNCLATAVYYESAEQSKEGKIGVGQVILNRMGDENYPKTICGVINQSIIKHNRKLCQFSWVCSKPPKIDYNSKAWEESQDVAFHMIIGNYTNDLLRRKHAIYFHNKDIQPSWSFVKQKIAKIDDHIFYSNKNKGKV